MKYRLVAVVAIFLLFCNAFAEYEEICRLLKNGSTFRKPGSCTQYITCNNNYAQTHTCTGDTLFDRSKLQCVASSTLSSDTYCSNRCVGKSGTWIPDLTSCRGFLYCSGDVPIKGQCPEGYHFSESSQQCIFDEDSSCLVVGNICETLPDKTRLLNENNCLNYYECSKDKLSSSACKSLYFDVQSGTCVDKQLVACTAHPLPKNVCGTAAKPSPGFKSDDATCRGYFACADLGIVPDLTPVWGQCPEGLFFNSTNQACVIPRNAICTNNRCEGRGSGLVATSKNNCHNYIICEDGKTVSEQSCRGDLFFDEERQACVKDIIEYTCCDGQKA
ncbi:peritrophin-44 [Teleopsis dalmanni]|uniref:peritrophin-44 n=1 Tax=Teleopsis dalmanni TaxID=139649 RepID=UPI0018CCAB66|nr:peritrophin-44 [Teleopsis dalmanni]